MTDATKYLFSGTCTLNGVDVVIDATADALRMQVTTVLNVNMKVAVIPHVSVMSGNFRGTVILLYMQS